MKKIEFTAKQIVGEFWIGFTDQHGIEIGIIVKKLSDGTYLIPTGTKKKTFVLDEIEHIQKNISELVQLPFVIGTTDYPATDAMKPDTFASFMKAFKQAFCVPESA